MLQVRSIFSTFPILLNFVFSSQMIRSVSRRVEFQRTTKQHFPSDLSDNRIMSEWWTILHGSHMLRGPAETRLLKEYDPAGYPNLATHSGAHSQPPTFLHETATREWQ